MKNIQYNRIHSIDIILNTNIHNCDRYSNVHCLEIWSVLLKCRMHVYMITKNINNNIYVTKIN